MNPEDDAEEDGANIDLDSQRKGKCVVLKTSTRQVHQHFLINIHVLVFYKVELIGAVNGIFEDLQSKNNYLMLKFREKRVLQGYRKCIFLTHIIAYLAIGLTLFIEEWSLLGYKSPGDRL